MKKQSKPKKVVLKETLEERLSHLETYVSKMHKDIRKQDKFIVDMLIDTENAITKIEKRWNNRWYKRLLKFISL